MFMIPIPKSPLMFPVVVGMIVAGALWAAIKISFTAFVCIFPVVYFTLKEVYREDAK